MSKILLSIFLIFCFKANANESLVTWNGNIYKIIYEFKKEFNKFSNKLCRPGDEKKYWELLTAFRGQGYYLPKYNDDIDRDAIRKNLHEMRKKIKYIQRTRKKLSQVSEYPKFSHLHVEVDSIIKQLLNLKKLYKQEIDKEKKNKILLRSRRDLIKLKKQFEIFMDQIFFMKSYNFPNEFLSYRETYEKYKYDLKNIKKANETYFYRKIVEDGALNRYSQKPDRFTRMALDTLYLNIQKEKDFLSEVVRYDLDWIERSLERFVSLGKSEHLSRLSEWERRTKKSLDFYSELLKTKNKKKAKFLVKKENENTQLLKEFIYKKQGDVYNYWAKKSELFKAMYVLDTILVNEVGVIDGEFGLERYSVSNVVLNRLFDDFYNQLNDDQMILDYIDKSIEVENEHWLNVLFKTGEFSFTYHYISGVSKIFCPDMSRRGKTVRSKNLKIALKALKKYNKNSFKAFRYFSRISMQGKIDMSTVWTNYVRLPEMAGYESSHQRKLMYHYLADKYQYLYSFEDEKGHEYTVIQIKNKTYSMRWVKGKPKFFDYRNPHLFAYFSKKK